MVKYLQSQEQERKYISSEPDAVSDDRMNDSKYDGMVVWYRSMELCLGTGNTTVVTANMRGPLPMLACTVLYCAVLYCTVLYCTVLAMLERDHMASGHDTRAIMI